jgi:hypothetical protein
MLAEPGRAEDLTGANHHGQQLFLANVRGHLHSSKTRIPRAQVTDLNADGFNPAGWRQAVLFELPFDPDVIRQQALTAESGLLAFCIDVAVEHATVHGWSTKHRNDVIRSLRMLAVLQDTPGAKVNATDVLDLTRYGGTVTSTLEVLNTAGLLIDDRPSPVERYFADKTDGLPEPMKTQLGTWLQVMVEGSTTVPRQRSRDPETIKIHISGIAAIIHGWAAQGHLSLAEITTDDILAVLPASGSRRHFAEIGLRSLFFTLKARKLVFADPTRGMPATPTATNIPMPLDTQAVRDALNSPDPRTAAAVALIAFHALTTKQLRELKLTDIVDGRLHLDGRVIPLADPVRVRLTAWLDDRARRWPDSINPHLFVSLKSGPRLTPIGLQFPWTDTNLKPQALREDRILQEIHATGGDIRRICDLFGLSVDGALRYAATLNHPDLNNPAAAGSPTPDPS